MTKCPHNDVRYFAEEKGAVACMDCGRLFGHLGDDDVFIPHNDGNLAVTIEARGIRSSDFDRKKYRVGLRRGKFDTMLWEGQGFLNAQEQHTAALRRARADDFVYIQDAQTGSCQGVGV